MLLFKRTVESTQGYKLQKNIMLHNILSQRSERATGDGARNSPALKSLCNPPLIFIADSIICMVAQLMELLIKNTFLATCDLFVSQPLDSPS